MSAPREILEAIGRAVEAQGGDLDDARHLLAEWERLAADRHGRLDRLRHEAAHPACACTDGGAPDDGGRCKRCHGLTGKQAAR
jgi:hypothetical protein